MGAGDEPGGAVGLGEVGERPHGVAHRRRVGLGQRDDLVVGVDRLRRLARSDGDRGERRHQEPGVEDPLEDGQDRGWTGIRSKCGPVGQQVVDAGGADPSKALAGRHDAELAFESVEVLVQGVDQVGLDGVLDDGVARPRRSVAGGSSTSRPWPRSLSLGQAAAYCETGGTQEASGQPLRAAHLCVEGHALVGTDAAAVTADDALLVREADGSRWCRCLRCDAWLPVAVPTQPDHGAGADPGRDRAAAAGPGAAGPLRAPAIALDRAIHVVVLTLLAIVFVHLRPARATLHDDYQNIMNDLSGAEPAARRRCGVSSATWARPSTTRRPTCRLAAIFIAYAALEAAEMVGLWFDQAVGRVPDVRRHHRVHPLSRSTSCP